MKISKARSIGNAQEGSVLIVALIMLALLSIIGFAVTTTSRLDIQIASNEYVAKQNLYAAEGAGVELMQLIENGGEEIKFMDASSPFWLVDNETGQNNGFPALPTTPFHPVDEPEFPAEIVNINLWEGTNTSLVRQSPFMQNNEMLEAIAFRLGIAKGASMDTTKPTVWAYRIYGRSNLYQGTRNDGWSIVEIGFKRVL